MIPKNTQKAREVLAKQVVIYMNVRFHQDYAVEEVVSFYKENEEAFVEDWIKHFGEEEKQNG